MGWFRSWWQNTSKTLDAVVILMLVVLVALVVVIILGYTNNWNWTGLRGKTLYDWLQLLIIPAVLAVGGYLFNFTTSRNEQKATQLRAQTEREAAEKQAQTERDIALDNQREAALQAYFDKISELLLHGDLRESTNNPQAINIAQARTATVLRILDPIRCASIIQFLSRVGILRLCVENSAKSSMDWPLKNEYSLVGIELPETNFNRVGLFLTFGDFGIAERFLPNLNWLLKPA